MILVNSRLYTLYQLEIKEIQNIRVIILITRKKNIKADMKTDLICNKDMLLMDVQKKTKNKK